MRETIANALIGFHCLTGCDTVSAFHGKGKVRPFELMVKSADAMAGVADPGSDWCVSPSTVAMLEKFISAIYGLNEPSVDNARYKLFGLRPLETA